VREANGGETAGHLMTERVPVLPDRSTVAEARSLLLAGNHDEPDPVWVVSTNGVLVGAVPLIALLRAAGSASLGALAVRGWPSVPADLDQEQAATLARGAGVSEIAVVDTGNRFLGAVPAKVLLDVVWREHVEDVQRLSGILHQVASARQALEDTLWHRLARRLPWLIVGLLGSVVAALVMAGFEAALSQKVALAFFVPTIVYLADAIGTQTEAAAVRMLSLGPLPLARSLLGEMAEGALIGTVLGILNFPVLLLIFGETSLALGVSLSLIAAGTMAAGLGLALPWTFAKAGIDPAYGAGPVGTIIQDVLSLAIYFAIMTRIIAQG